MIAVGAGVLCLVTALIYWGLESAAESKYELGERGSIDELEFRQIFLFNRSYWYVVGLCFTFYSAIFPFRTFAIELLMNKTAEAMAGGPSSDAIRAAALGPAGFLNSLLPATAMVATPLFGFLVDRVGKRALLMVLGSFLLMPVYLMLAYAPYTQTITLHVPWHGVWNLPLWPLIATSMMGIAFSLVPAVMWPSVAYIVDQSRLGTAYALMTLIQQIGFFLLNLMVGAANDYSHAGPNNVAGYALGMWIFSVLGFVGLTFAILLRIRETGPEGHGLETITVGSS